jgi:membrane-bound lytic murein transglycosylase B
MPIPDGEPLRRGICRDGIGRCEIGSIMARDGSALQHRRGIFMTLRVSRRIMLAAPIFAATGAGEGLAKAAEGDFYTFLGGVRRDALAHGIRASTVDAAFRNVQFLPRVVELDRKQPERTMTFTQYIAKVVTPERKDNARRQLAENRVLLDAISRRYNVEPSVIVALWGLESDFGRLPGNFPTISALATLTYDGRRGAYFRSELMAALRILDHGYIRPEEMTGSWAGAMGGPQFMPSSYLDYAVDYDGDGRRDIWNSRGDVLASIANYIRGLGWRGGQIWGQDVLVPSGFDPGFAGLKAQRPMAEWSRLGIRTLDAGPLLSRESEASLVMPEGANGPALLVYPNFRAIMKWNPSTYFAVSVGYLADSVARG